MTGASTPIRVLVADDHPLYRDGLVRLLDAEHDLEVIAQAEDGAQAFEQIAALAPHVAVLDLMLPGMDAIAVIERLEGRSDPPSVIVVSASLESDVVYRAIEAGALGYVPKTSSGTEIVEAVRTVAGGGVAISPAVQVGLATVVRRRRDVVERPPLSDREVEILRLAAEGMTVSAIAQELFVSPATVKTHLHHTYEKLAVPDRTAAVAQAMRLGLLD